MNNSHLFNTKFIDHRGSLYTIFDQRYLNIVFVQDKISRSKKNVIRGFHGDNKTWKLITCIYGSMILATYNLLTEEKSEYTLQADRQLHHSILVPPNTLNAHKVLSHECIMHYKWSEYYTSPEDQWSVHFTDPDIGLDWGSYDFIVSERDATAGSLKDLKKELGLC